MWWVPILLFFVCLGSLFSFYFFRWSLCFSLIAFEVEVLFCREERCSVVLLLLQFRVHVSILIYLQEADFFFWAGWSSIWREAHFSSCFYNSLSTVFENYGDNILLVYFLSNILGHVIVFSHNRRIAYEWVNKGKQRKKVQLGSRL